MNEELQVLLTVAQKLTQANIPYLISGSMAANYYTIPRMTRDIDVIIELSQRNEKEFIAAFEKDFWIDAEMVSREVSGRGMFNVIHKECLIKVDCILHKDSPFQKSMFERRKDVALEGQHVWLISHEDLVLAKLLWAKDSLSELQLNDVRNLLEKDGLDKGYIELWISKLGLEAVYKRVHHA